MNLKTTLLLSLASFGGIDSIAQETRILQSTRDRLQNNYFNPDYSDFYIYGMEGRRGSVVGDVYLDTTFVKGKVIFYQTEIARNGKSFKLDSLIGVGLRLDLKNNELELSSPYGIKAVKGNMVRKFAIQKIEGMPESIFVSTSEFSGQAMEHQGFYEVLAEGRLNLLLHHKLVIKGPTYNTALAVGSKDTEIFKEKHFYFAQGKEVARLNRNRSGLLKIMNDKKAQMEVYLSGREVDFRNSAHLGQIFSYYNSL
jgi:hypothetical protein